MICNKCGKELPDDSVFCSQCGNNLSQTGGNANDISLEQKKSLNKKVIIPGVLLGIIAILLISWFFSNIVFINLSQNAIKDDNLVAAQDYLKYSCPFGYKNNEIKILKLNIAKVGKYIEDSESQLEVNDFVSAINNGKEAVNLLSYSPAANELYQKSSKVLYDNLCSMYSENKFSKAADVIGHLSEEVINDTSNTLITEIKEMYEEKSMAFLSSAKDYYNNYQPDNAAVNLSIVLALSPENQEANDLQSKLDTYTQNKAYIDEAQKLYDSGDYSNAKSKFDEADEYTKTVHKELREKIVNAEEAAAVDLKYGSYVGWYAARLDVGSFTATITKIADGCIWMSFESSGADYGVSGSVNGASISSGTIRVKGNGEAIDYSPNNLGGRKSYSNNNTFTLKDGMIYVSIAYPDKSETFNCVLYKSK